MKAQELAKKRQEEAKRNYKEFLLKMNVPGIREKGEKYSFSK
jgi:hypothetical protein